MRRIMVEAAATAALIMGAALAWAQQPSPPPAPVPKPDVLKPEPAKSKLEEMIEKALHDNPDLRLAEAKLAEAEAELNKARLLVVQKVAAQYQAVEAQKAAVDGAAAELEETKTAYKAASVSQSMVRTAEQKLIDAKAKLASLEAELPYLLGQQAEGKIDAKIRLWLDRIDISQPPKNADAEYLRRWYLDVNGRQPTLDEMLAAVVHRPIIQGSTADRIRAALDKPFTYEGKGGKIGEVILALKDAFENGNPGLLINVNGISKIGGEDSSLPPYQFNHVPFGAALEWVEDSLPECRIVVRDYGIAVVPKDAPPPGAPLLHDFWKGAKAEDKTLERSLREKRMLRWSMKFDTSNGDDYLGQLRGLGAILAFPDGPHQFKVVDLAKGPPYQLEDRDLTTIQRVWWIDDNAASVQSLMAAMHLPGRPVRVIAFIPPELEDDLAEKELAFKGLKEDQIRETKFEVVNSGGKYDVRVVGQEPKDKPPAKEDPKPAAPVEGRVKEVMIRSNGLQSTVLVTLGSGDGLAKGDVLSVVRQESENGRALLLGQLRVVRVGEGESTTEPLGDLKQPIRVGDKVYPEPKDKPPAKDPSANPLEGKITAHRADGNVVLSIGSDAGVSVGDEFEAYQPGKTPGTDVNMGPVRVTEVTPKQSVAKLTGAFMTLPQEGWRVVRIGSAK